MKTAGDWRGVLAEVEQARLCSHPVRLRGIRLITATGELVETDLLVPCKDRRAAVCPSCSRLYQADAWQLVAAGIRGGKGVSPDVVEHPQLFVTLTAPSFGPVHRGPRRDGVSLPCRPRRKAGTCAHGVALSCRIHHDGDDPVVGEPLCTGCFDYVGAVLWNAHVPRLWVRTSLEIHRQAARAAGLTSAELRRAVRLSYMKVVEFQRRGLVHLHVVVRADGAEGPSEAPPPWLGLDALRAAVSASVARASVALPAWPAGGLARSRAAWGREIDIRPLVATDPSDATAIAAYVAKYATKTADGTPWLAHPIRSAAQLERLELRPHVVHLVRTAWRLGTVPELRALRLRAHAHTLGYTGQFSSKSRRYSTTFGALRAARLAHVQGAAGAVFECDGEWRYLGRGYGDPVAHRVAESLLEAAPTSRRRFPTASTPGSTSP
jgi:hypothetical protein